MLTFPSPEPCQLRFLAAGLDMNPGGPAYLFLQLLKMMEQFPDVVFLKVNFDANKDICKTLGVKVWGTIVICGAEHSSSFTAGVASLPACSQNLWQRKGGGGPHQYPCCRYCRVGQCVQAAVKQRASHRRAVSQFQSPLLQAGWSNLCGSLY